DEHLVEGLLPLIVPASVACTAGAAHCIQLVDEEDTRRMASALLEEVPHPACTHTDEHLYKVGAGHMEESHVRLACDGFCEKGLARSRHADKEDSLWDLGSEPGKLLRALQELHDFLQLVLGLILACNVDERDALVRVQVPFCPALPEGKRLVSIALYLPEHEPDEKEADDPGKELDKHGERRYRPRAAGDFHSLVFQGLHEIRVRVGNGGCEKAQVTGLRLERPLDLVLVDYLDAVYLAFGYIGLES